MRSDAPTVEQYLQSLPPERRAALEAIRAVILKNLNPGFVETMHYGMIGYVVPHTLYPPGYHCNPAEPLPFASLASQKNHMSLHMMSLDEGGDDAWFRDAWQRTGLRLDMGKCCVRFKRLQDVPLGVIAEAFKRVTPADHIARYELSRTTPQPRSQPHATSANRRATPPARKAPHRTPNATSLNSPAAKNKPARTPTPTPSRATRARVKRP